MTHIPRGSMCIACKHRARAECKDLPFASMPIYRRWPDVVQVICTEFERGAQ